MKFEIAGQYVLKNPFRNEVAIIKIDELADFNNFDTKVEILKSAEEKTLYKLGLKGRNNEMDRRIFSQKIL